MNLTLAMPSVIENDLNLPNISFATLSIIISQNNDAIPDKNVHLKIMEYSSNLAFYNMGYSSNLENLIENAKSVSDLPIYLRCSSKALSINNQYDIRLSLNLAISVSELSNNPNDHTRTNDFHLEAELISDRNEIGINE